MLAVRMLIVILVILLVVGFGIQNAGERVDVRVFTTTYMDYPMVWVVLLGFAAGMVACFLIAVTYYFRIKAEARAQRREARRLQEEITALRNRPIQQVDIREPDRE